MSKFEYSRHDIKTFEQADALAAEATKQTGFVYLAVDNGECVWPRYDIVEAPAVGDKVSGYVNGDYYPQGEIVSIAKNHRFVTTDSGKRFYRKRLTGSWIHSNYLSLYKGIKNERNPHI